MVKASTWRGEDPEFKSCLQHRYSGSSHTSDLKIGTPVATLPGAWHYRISTGTGWPCVSILWLGEMESLICNFYLSVAAHTIVWADPSLRYTSMLLGHLASKQETNQSHTQDWCINHQGSGVVQCVWLLQVRHRNNTNIVLLACRKTPLCAYSQGTAVID